MNQVENNDSIFPERVNDPTLHGMAQSFELHSPDGFHPIMQPTWTHGLQPIQALRSLDINGSAGEATDAEKNYMGMDDKHPIRGL